MAEGGVERSADRFSCTICLEDYKKPKLLPCFHTFCATCLDTFIEKHRKGNQFNCPLCRTNIDVPGKGVDGFQANFYIETAKGSSEDIVTPCDLCGPKTQAIYRCTECEENLCAGCGAAHLKSKGTRNHKVIELTSLDSATSRKLVSRVFCTVHPQEEIKMFCKQCDSLLCMVCKMTTHENHSTSDIASEGKNMRQKLKSFLQGGRIRTQLGILGDCITRQNEMQQRIKVSLDQGVRTIREQAKALHTAIDNITTDYEKSLQKSYVEWQLEVQHYREQLERESKSLAACSDTLKLIIDHDSDTEMLRNGKKLEIKIEDLCVQKHPDKRETYPEKSFVAGNIDEAVLKAMVGTVHLEREKQPTLKKNRSKKNLSPDKLKQLKTINVPEFGCISGIAPAGNGKAWISSYNNSQLKFIDLNGGDTKTFESGSRCHDVTTNVKKEAITSCRNDKMVKVVKLDAGSKTIISNLDMFPQGVCCYTTDDGKEEVLLTCTNHPYYDGTKGNIYRCDTKDYTPRPVNLEGCIAPIRIAVEPETGMICTADYKNKTVTIHDPSGKLVAKYTDSNCWPVDVHFYDDQRIIAVNYCKDIRVIRVDGSLENILKQIGCYSVTVDDDDNLWVGTYKDVQIFKIN